MEPLREGEGVAAFERWTLTSRSTRLPRRSVRAVLTALEGPRVLWSAPDEPVVAGAGHAAVVVATDGRFDAIRRRARSMFDGAVNDGPSSARPRLVGGMAFHDAGGRDGPWEGFPAAAFVIPERQVTWDGGEMWLTVSSTESSGGEDAVERRLDRVANRLVELPEPGATPSGPGIEATRRRPGRARWEEQVTELVDRIRSGELRKVVLAQQLEATLDGAVSIPDVLDRLGRSYPGCRRFLFEPVRGRAFFGVTPERLVSLEGRTVHAEALAGSTGRGDTPDEDAWLARELERSEKDRHEHDLVTEAILERLRPLSIAVDAGDRSVTRLATVQHLRTPIEATLDRRRHVLDLVDALHPTPAVGGLPPAAALEAIETIEGFERGWYAGPIGWMDGDGDGSFAVGIRSAVTAGRRATLFAGAGIVADSDPHREWDEVQLKYRPVLDALA